MNPNSSKTGWNPASDLFGMITVSCIKAWTCYEKKHELIGYQMLQDSSSLIWSCELLHPEYNTVGIFLSICQNDFNKLVQRNFQHKFPLSRGLLVWNLKLCRHYLPHIN